jgi:hypothetical protein
VGKIQPHSLPFFGWGKYNHTLSPFLGGQNTTTLSPLFWVGKIQPHSLPFFGWGKYNHTLSPFLGGENLGGANTYLPALGRHSKSNVLQPGYETEARGDAGVGASDRGGIPH